MTRTVLLILFFAISWASTSRADVAPPEVYACYNVSLGDSCKIENGAKGVCQDSTCYGNDFANWDRDASPNPPRTPYACLECVPKDDTNESSGCSMSGARVIAPWLLAGIFAACVTLLRRRPRR